MRVRIKLRRCATFVILLLLASVASFVIPVAADNPNAPADITIGATVIAANPERFGANVQVGDYQAFDPTATTFNNWVGDSGMEPIVLRLKGTATGGGSNYIENTEGQTTSANNTIADGFFDGAEVRMYRVVNGHVQLLRTNTVARYLASTASGYRINLDSDGPPVQRGDSYFLTMISNDAPVDRLNSQFTSGRSQDTWQPYPNNSMAATKTRDSSTVAAVDGGRTSLRVNLTNAIEGGVFQNNTGSPSQMLLNSYVPGRTYQVEMWLKQQGVPSSNVRFWMDQYPENIQHTFAVTSQWAKYSFTFTGPNPLPSNAPLSSIYITFNGPGTIWIDNVRIYDLAQAPFAMRPEVVQAFADFKPGTVRIWSEQTSRYWGNTLDNWLTPEGQQMRLWNPVRGRTVGQLFNLPTALSFARRSFRNFCT